MQEWFTPLITQLLAWLAFPQHGLSTVFTIAFISATLLPLGSEPAVFGLIKLNPDLFWQAIFVATAGNTLGGMLSWWMGYGTHQAVDMVRKHKGEIEAEIQAPKTGMNEKCTSVRWNGWKSLGPKPVYFLGCPALETPFAPWQVGSRCPSCHAPFTWPSESFCVT